MTLKLKNDDNEDLSLRDGQLFEPIRHHRRRSKRLDHEELRLKTEKIRIGISHEKKFVSYTRKLIEDGRLPHHFKAVRKASEIEDKRFKVDAKIRVCYWFAPEHEIKVQIKTSVFGAETFRGENPGILDDIHIVIVNDETTPEHLRAELKNILRKEEKRLIALRRSPVSPDTQQQLPA